MASAGASRLLLQDELTPERLTNEIFSSWTSPGEFKRWKTARVRWHVRARWKISLT